MSHDITADLQTRIDSGDRDIYIPPAEYSIRTVIMRPRVRIHGVMFATRLNSLTGQPAFVLGNGGLATPFADGMSLQELSIIGAGVVADAGCFTTLHRLEIRNAPTHHIILKRSTGPANEIYTTITSCYLTGQKTMCGVYSEAGTYGVRVGPLNTFSGLFCGVFGASSDTWQVDFNQFDECNIPLRFMGMSDSEASHNTSQQSDQNAYELIDCSNILVADNRTLNPGYSQYETYCGVALHNSKRCQVRGNRIRMREGEQKPQAPPGVTDIIGKMHAGVEETGTSDWNEIGPNMITNAVHTVLTVGPNTKVLLAA